jgi:AraC-like DNA-binding protein
MKPPITAGAKFISTHVTEARRYFLDLNPRSDCALAVVCGGVERCSPDYEIRRDTFPYVGIEFVAEGLGTLELSGREHVLRPGTAFAYAPGIPHRIRNSTQAPMLKYYMDFAGRDARKLLKSTPLGLWKPVQVAAPHEIIDLFESLQRNGTVPTTWTHSVCVHLLSLIVLKISELEVPAGAVGTRAFPTYQRIRRHIEAHYLELRTVEEIADACHVNASYLCRLFQRFARHSPYQLLLRLKMDRAAALLLESDMPIKEVSAMLGFSDPFHFSRSFKRLFGLAPAVFVVQGRRSGRSWGEASGLPGSSVPSTRQESE